MADTELTTNPMIEALPSTEEHLLAEYEESCNYRVNLPPGSKRPRFFLDNHTTSAGIPKRLVIEFPEEEQVTGAACNNHHRHRRIPISVATNSSQSVDTEKPKTNQRKEEVTVLRRSNSILYNGSSSSTEVDHEMTAYASKNLDTDRLPPVDTLAAPKLCSSRLQHLIGLLENGSELNKKDIVNNLKYSISVLDTLYIEETKRLFDDDDALNEVEPDAVPTEVREWLAQTFTRSQSVARVRGIRPRFKSVATAVTAGLHVHRIRRMSSFENAIHPPVEVVKCLKYVDSWSFNVFSLQEKSEGHALKYLGHELLKTQGLLERYRIHYSNLDNFLLAMESGYSKYNNPYHNLIHGADVAQTAYHLLLNSGLLKWLSEIEVFAVIIAALIHDYEHNGTTNNFHIMSRTPLAMLYNDKAVLENHHVCAAFELMRSEDKNILSGLKDDEYREFRALVIDMVLATDMSCHFQQLKNMKSMLGCPEKLEKSKVLCLMLHTADISHPSKPWEIHKRWTDSLLEEFFKQGDREKGLGIACSPLCDRQATLVEKSQIGFIDFIVQPSFNILGDMFESINEMIIPENLKSHTENTTIKEESAFSETGETHQKNMSTQMDFKMNRVWDQHIAANRDHWKTRSGITEEDSEPSKEMEPETPKKAAVNRSTSITGLSPNLPDSRSRFGTYLLTKQTSTTALNNFIPPPE